MNPLKLLRKVVKFIRGGGGPLQLLLACMLGLTLGLTPGFNLTNLLLVLAIIVLNVSIGLATFAAIIGKLLQLGLAEVLFNLGHFMMHRLGLAGLIGWLADTPVLALLNLHVYSVPAAIVLGAVAGFILGLPFVWIIIRIRRTLAAAIDKNAALQKLSANIFVRMLMRLLFGKAKMTLAETLTARPPVLRKSGIMVAAVLALLLAGGTLLAVDYVLPGRLAGMAGYANGAQVDIRKADFSFFGGRFSIEGLQVTDRNEPSQNLFAADRLEASVSVADLLARRLVINRIEVTGATSGSSRTSAGQVYPRGKQDETDDEGIVLTDYFEKAQEYRKYLDYLRQIREYLSKQEQKANARTPEEIRRQAQARGYLSMSCKDLLAKHPSMVIRELVIDRIVIPGWGMCRIAGKELSTDPSLNTQPMSLLWADVSAEDARNIGSRQKLTVGFDPARGSRFQMELRFADLPVQGLSKRMPIDAAGGKAIVSASGEFSAAWLAMQMQIDVTDLNSRCRPGQGVLGLSPDTSAKVFDNLKQIRLAGVLTGTIDRPQLRLDERATLESLKAGLAGAAKAELAARLDEQIGKLPAGLSAAGIGQALQAPASLPADLGSLLPAQEGDQDKAAPIRRLLDGIGR